MSVEIDLPTCIYCGRDGRKTKARPGNTNIPLASYPPTPQPGESALCFGCAGISIFTGTPEKLGLRVPELWEYIAIMSQPSIVEHVHRIWQHKAECES